ncbi:MAG: LON peptidase substrate-binding domain-containing protein [Armatimonadota bacterium]
MDEMDRVRSLPLFPLDLVLFPHMLVPLHIFEERYRQLVRRCTETGETFGIVLATGQDPDDAGPSGVRTAPVGCVARIVRCDLLPDGRYNLHVEGGDRFRIVDTHESEPYRTGLVMPFEDELVDPVDIPEEIGRMQDALSGFLKLQMERLGQEVGELSLPDDPGILGFTASCILPVENPVKQELLELRDPAERLRRAEALLADANRMLQRRPAPARKVFDRIDIPRFAKFRCRN